MPPVSHVKGMYCAWPAVPLAPHRFVPEAFDTSNIGQWITVGLTKVAAISLELSP